MPLHFLFGVQTGGAIELRRVQEIKNLGSSKTHPIQRLCLSAAPCTCYHQARILHLKVFKDALVRSGMTGRLIPAPNPIPIFQARISVEWCLLAARI